MSRPPRVAEGMPARTTRRAPILRRALLRKYAHATAREFSRGLETRKCTESSANRSSTMSYRALARGDVSRREYRHIFQERHSAVTIRGLTTAATDFLHNRLGVDRAIGQDAATKLPTVAPCIVTLRFISRA